MYRERGGFDMKELYETPTVEFIEFDSEEVITMSTGKWSYVKSHFKVG